MLQQTVGEIIASQEVIVRGRHHLENSPIYGQQCHVERCAPQSIHENIPVALLVKAIRHRTRGRFIDDTQNFQSSQLTCILRGLALSIIEMCGHRNHRIIDLFAQVILSCLLHVFQRV
mmetsp:Transcript_110470/g.285577  ORF Transcript_110470/g.285577 Transcript_110470/m.285577 type:complete len:118 (+) Transcript_110470:693-1046(+)